MTNDEQKTHFEKLVDRMRTMMFKKGNDYSVIEDRLSNFKQAGYITNTHPAKVALIMASIKISRMCALIDSGKKPENEAMTDSSIDLCCYSILTDAVLNEDQFTIRRPNKDDKKKEDESKENRPIYYPGD